MADDGFVFVTSASPNSVSSVTMSSLPTGYEAFHIIYNLDLSQNGGDFYLQINSGYTGNSALASHYMNSSGQKFVHNVTAYARVGRDTKQGNLFGEIVLMNPNNTSYDITGRVEYYNMTSNYDLNASKMGTGGFGYSGNQSLSSINLVTSSGTITGTIDVYGMVK